MLQWSALQQCMDRPHLEAIGCFMLYTIYDTGGQTKATQRMQPPVQLAQQSLISLHLKLICREGQLSHNGHRDVLVAYLRKELHHNVRQLIQRLCSTPAARMTGHWIVS